MSEMRTAIRTTNRINPKDKEKAVATARNVKSSEMGKCILNDHIREDPGLQPSLARIGSEQTRKAQSLQQTRKRFLQQSQLLNREPMILVERAPTFNAVTRATFMSSYGIDPGIALLPSYMRPLQSRSRTPSTLTTIEAFTAESKRKRNVWDEVLDAEPKFKSIAKPSARLTQEEITQLQAGYLHHKPRAEHLKAKEVRSPGLSRSKTMGSVFVTQLPRDGSLGRKSESRQDKTGLVKSEKSTVESRDSAGKSVRIITAGHRTSLDE